MADFIEICAAVGEALRIDAGPARLSADFPNISAAKKGIELVRPSSPS
ncbi:MULTISPECIES: hypothetical protein [unclassified Lysobacter]|nr:MULTISPECIES: hypothetical protein [unclassified Lysobacter]